MCGIAGFIDPNLSTENAQQVLSSMLQATHHRGPDYTGAWHHGDVHLGHNRLSIIDLHASANQPMHYDQLSIVFNGEVYNYLEIKKELVSLGYHFTTQSDTEVILAAYKHWGTSCLQKFVGMWAFALWDHQTQTLFCARDRFGIKPFYYSQNGNRFYFGSEYKNLKESPLFSSELNMNQVALGLQLGWVSFGNETYYSSIKQLPQAHYLTIHQGKLSIHRYWDITQFETNNNSHTSNQEAFYELFKESIDLHMRSDVEVGACLSGGIDSSAIVSMIGKSYPTAPVKTFTIYYTGNQSVDERPWANKVIEQYPQIENHTYSPSSDELSEVYLKTLFYADVPIAGSSPLSQYLVMKLAAKHGIKVVLDGQGSDEYLAGYMHSFYRLTGGLLKAGKLNQAWNALKHHKQQQQFGYGKMANAFSKSVLTALFNEQQLYTFEYQKYFPHALSTPIKTPFDLQATPNASKLNSFLYQLTFASSLPSLLHYEDRNSMAFSIESRVPFLDHRLVEFAFALKDESKIAAGKTKTILRKALHGILPEAIANRSDKKGFVTPGEVKWLRGELKWLLQEPLLVDWIQKPVMQKELAEFANGDNRNANWIWRLVTLNQWLKTNA
ncbi:MAG: asparagine synthase (glutamine-hydrolyzing) [Bacteroidia bacterium]|jgi:asparagine synthase (glutamine-hydrolysing)|nr:asparagine synthase (glutamine-hydrolyzing) [Bacteroidia bacterium]